MLQTNTTIKNNGGKGRLVLAVMLLFPLLAVAPNPVGAIGGEIDPDAPDMCDDGNTWPTGPDEWNQIDADTPNKAGDVVIVPTLASSEKDVAQEDQDLYDELVTIGVLPGLLHYSWVIYECIDHTGLNSAGFYVYKASSSFDEDQGQWSQWEDDPVIADTPHIIMYQCDNVNCGIQGPGEPTTREQARQAAEIYATRWPTYESAVYGHATYKTHSFDGSYHVSSDSANIAPAQKFQGCSGAVCVTATAEGGSP